MIVDAEVWCWTAQGMRQANDTDSGYITVRDVERLLEEAHRRGYERRQQYEELSRWMP